jgi:tetratricopeptide (TPR) repeat protein
MAVFSTLRLTRPRDGRAVGAALATITVIAVASGCGGGSSGHTASPATTLEAGLKLQQQGKLSEAAQLYQQVITAQPNNVFAHYDLGVVEQASSNPIAALASYGSALTINPKYVPALYNQATIYAATDPALAISLYRQVVGLQPTAPTAYLNLGLLEIKHDAPKRGVADLAKAITQDPTLLARVPKNLQALVQRVAGSSTASTSTSSPPPASTPSASSTS